MSECILIDDLEIEVRRSQRRKNIDLQVDRNGQVVVAVPAALSVEKISEVCTQKKIWIYQTLTKKQQSIHPLRQKRYVSGEGFYYLGRKYRLKLTDNRTEQKTPLRFQDGRFWLDPAAVPQGHELFVKWYSQSALPWHEKKVANLSPRVARSPGSVKVRDLGFRWASCTKKGHLLFHWRIILLPAEHIEYLILHELVHLIEHSHNADFYNRLRWACPDYQLHENWLRINGDKYVL